MTRISLFLIFFTFSFVSPAQSNETLEKLKDHLWNNGPHGKFHQIPTMPDIPLIQRALKKNSATIPVELHYALERARQNLG